MNRNELIDILTAVQVGDHRTIGQVDVDFWTAVIGDLPKDLAMRAVIEHRREEPGVWLEPGHVYQRVRAIRRDMLEREPDEMRDARQEMLAVKVAQEVTQLAKSIPEDEPPKYTRPSANPAVAPWLQVACPYCHARAGQRCTNSATKKQLQAAAHPARITAAAGHEHHTTWPICTACHTRPLVTDEARDHGVCTPCQQASTPQPETEVPERNNA